MVVGTAGFAVAVEGMEDEDADCKIGAMLPVMAGADVVEMAEASVGVLNAELREIKIKPLYLSVMCYCTTNDAFSERMVLVWEM